MKSLEKMKNFIPVLFVAFTITVAAQKPALDLKLLDTKGTLVIYNTDSTKVAGWVSPELTTAGDIQLFASRYIQIVVFRTISPDQSAVAEKMKIKTGHAYVVNKVNRISLGKDLLSQNLKYEHLCEVDLNLSDIQIAKKIGMNVAITPAAFLENGIAWRAGEAGRLQFFIYCL
jgi:hypothetical protein